MEWKMEILDFGFGALFMDTPLTKPVCGHAHAPTIGTYASPILIIFQPHEKEGPPKMRTLSSLNCYIKLLLTFPMRYLLVACTVILPLLIQINLQNLIILLLIITQNTF